MNKKFVILSIIMVIALVACGSDQEAKQETKHTASAQIVYYGCPMTEHSHSAAKEASKCELCGMDMVAVVKTTEGEHDFYGCPMAEHSHIRNDGPGTCADCGMTYRPMKFDI